MRIKEVLFHKSIATFMYTANINVVWADHKPKLIATILFIRLPLLYFYSTLQSRRFDGDNI